MGKTSRPISATFFIEYYPPFTLTVGKQKNGEFHITLSKLHTNDTILFSS
jgi:hypothetical protein